MMLCVRLYNGFGDDGREGRRAERGEEWNCLRGADGVVVDKERCAAEGNRERGVRLK